MDSLKDLLGRAPSEEPFMDELRGEPPHPVASKP